MFPRYGLIQLGKVPEKDEYYVEKPLTVSFPEMGVSRDREEV